MKRFARLVALVGAVGIGYLLLGARPSDVVLVYDVSAVPDATTLEVDLRSGGTLVRHAYLQLHPREQQRHPVQLRKGSYDLGWRLVGPSGARSGTRPLEVEGDETIVLPLGR